MTDTITMHIIRKHYSLAFKQSTSHFGTFHTAKDISIFLSAKEVEKRRKCIKEIVQQASCVDDSSDFRLNRNVIELIDDVLKN